MKLMCPKGYGSIYTVGVCSKLYVGVYLGVFSVVRSTKGNLQGFLGKVKGISHGTFPHF